MLLDEKPEPGARHHPDWAAAHADLTYHCGACRHRIHPAGGPEHTRWVDNYRSTRCPLEPYGFIGPAGPPSHRGGKLRPTGEHHPDAVSRDQFDRQQTAWKNDE